MNSKDMLLKILYEKSFLYRPDEPFKLKSGKESPLYFNCKPTMLDPVGYGCIGNVLFDLFIEKEYIERVAGNIVVGGNYYSIGGIETGAYPLALSVVKETGFNPIIVRKKPKGHGTQAWIEGNYEKGDKVIVVEDVITTGGSTVTAIEKMIEAGLEPIHCIVLIDRQEFDGKLNIENALLKGKPDGEYPSMVTSIFTADYFTTYNC